MVDNVLLGNGTLAYQRSVARAIRCHRLTVRNPSEPRPRCYAGESIGGSVTEAEYRDKVRAALLEGLLSFNGAAYNEETMQAMLEKVIEVWPPRDPIQWVESVKIENGVFHYKLTPEATELLR